MRLVASCRLQRHPARQLGGAFQARTFTLPPTDRATIVLNATAGAGPTPCSSPSGLAADLSPVGAPPTGRP